MVKFHWEYDGFHDECHGLQWGFDISHQQKWHFFFRPKTRGQLRYITLKELDKEGYRSLWDFRTGSSSVATSVAGNAQQKKMPNLVKSEWVGFFQHFIYFICPGYSTITSNQHYLVNLNVLMGRFEWHKSHWFPVVSCWRRPPRSSQIYQEPPWAPFLAVIWLWINTYKYHF